MRAKNKRPELEDIISFMFTGEGKFKGPRVIADFNLRLHLDEAEEISRRLQQMGYDVRPYDFPYTINVWSADNRTGTPYKQEITKRMILRLSGEKADYHTFDGFKKILPYLNILSFRKVKINEWGTTLSGLICTYNSSASAAVLDLVASDPEFMEFREDGNHPLHGYDFPEAPDNTWVDKKTREFTGLALAKTRDLIYLMAEELSYEDNRVFPNTLGGFLDLFQNLSKETFVSYPINEWGTTLAGMLRRGSSHSYWMAIHGVIQNYEEFEGLRDVITEDFFRAYAKSRSGGRDRLINSLYTKQK